jgi:hypothetical protein
VEFEGDGHPRRARGFIIGLLGSFMIILSSILVVVGQKPAYLILGFLSVLTLVLASFAFRSSGTAGRLLFLASTSTVLAAEASVALLYFYAPAAIFYGLATLTGSLLAAKGIAEMEGVYADRYDWRKKWDSTPEELKA